MAKKSMVAMFLELYLVDTPLLPQLTVVFSLRLLSPCVIFPVK